MKKIIIFKKEGIKKLFIIDQNILEENSSNDKNIDIFILQYPKGNEVSISSGKIKYILGNVIYHNTTTIEGSSGSSIIIRDNYNIIGLHLGGKIAKEQKELIYYNLGTIIKAIINDIKNNIPKNSIILIKNEDNSKHEMKNRKDFVEKLKKDDKLNLIKYKAQNFCLLTSIKPIFKLTPSYYSKDIIRRRFLPELNGLKKFILVKKGFQVYGIIGNKLIGVIESPPNYSFLILTNYRLF